MLFTGRRGNLCCEHRKVHDQGRKWPKHCKRKTTQRLQVSRIIVQASREIVGGHSSPARTVLQLASMAELGTTVLFFIFIMFHQKKKTFRVCKNGCLVREEDSSLVYCMREISVPYKIWFCGKAQNRRKWFCLVHWKYTMPSLTQEHAEG